MSIFSKVWSTADDGRILYGADLGAIQEVLDDLFANGITNSHIASNAGIAETKIAFSNNAAGHTHDNSSTGGSYVVIPHYRQKAEVVWASVSSVYAKPGILEIGGKLLIRTTVSTTRTDTTNGDWIGGTASAGSSKWYYVYAYNDSGVSWDIKISDSAPNTSDTSSNANGDLLYRQFSGVWYRCLQAVRNDSGGDLIKFYSVGDVVIYDAWTTALSGGTDTSFTDQSLATAVPPVSTRALIVLETTGTTMQIHVRANGSTATDGHRYDLAADDTVDVWCDTDTSQVIEYKIVSGTSADIHVKGYINNC